MMDFNTIPWTAADIWSQVFLMIAAFASTGFPVEYFFRSKWRIDGGAKVILASKTTLAALLHAAWIFALVYHTGWVMPDWLAIFLAVGFYSAIAATQLAMWIWMHRILSAAVVRSEQEEGTHA
jgi:hypothetical protein